MLGRGGMSVVYLAEHPRLKNKVALKLLAPALAEDDVFRERLVRESRLAASLNHPNVIPVYDTGEEDGVLYVSMRFVAGHDLRALIRDGGPLSLSETTSVITQAAAALDAAHAAGLVHRDIKPANILLEQGGEPPGHVYVADFGLTTHTDARSGATASGVVGTVDYMAPEQIEGRQIDGRADVYALGCVLFECLVGRPPFKLDTDVAVLWAHIREDPPLPGDVDRSLPRAFDGIVDRALAKSPRDRYATCGELAADVRAAAGTHRRPARAGRVRAPRPRVRTRRRWQGPAVLALVLGAAAGAIGAIVIRGDGHRAAAPSSTLSTLSQSLLANVPAGIRSSCRSAPPPSPDFDASVVCSPADPTVTSVRYSHARSASRMRASVGRECVCAPSGDARRGGPSDRRVREGQRARSARLERDSEYDAHAGRPDHAGEDTRAPALLHKRRRVVGHRMDGQELRRLLDRLRSHAVRALPVVARPWRPDRCELAPAV